MATEFITTLHCVGVFHLPEQCVAAQLQGEKQEHRRCCPAALVSGVGKHTEWRFLVLGKPFRAFLLALLPLQACPAPKQSAQTLLITTGRAFHQRCEITVLALLG